MDGSDQGNWSRNTGVPHLIANLIVMVIVNHQRHTTIACGQDKTTSVTIGEEVEDTAF